MESRSSKAAFEDCEQYLPEDTLIEGCDDAEEDGDHDGTESDDGEDHEDTGSDENRSDDELDEDDADRDTGSDSENDDDQASHVDDLRPDVCGDDDRPLRGPVITASGRIGEIGNRTTSIDHAIGTSQHHSVSPGPQGVAGSGAQS